MQELIAISAHNADDPVTYCGPSDNSRSRTQGPIEGPSVRCYLALRMCQHRCGVQDRIIDSVINRGRPGYLRGRFAASWRGFPRFCSLRAGTRDHYCLAQKDTNT